MSWQCPICHGTKVFGDLAGDEPELLGCLECNWDKVVEDERYDRLRCTASTSGLGGYGGGRRCSRPALLSSGYCWQHTERTEMWEVVYQRFRNAGRDDIPEAYRQIFRRALRDAEIVIRDQQHESELVERAKQVRAMPETGPSLVYFVEREGLIKIGFTTNLDKRIKSISKGSSMPEGMTIGPVKLLAAEPGDRKLEARLHQRFSSTRVGNSEWFRPSKALRRYIEDLARFQQCANAA